MSGEQTEDRAFRAWDDFDRICDHDNMTRYQYFLEGWRGGENAARTPGTAALGTPVGEIEGRAVLVGGVQGRARQPDVARLLAAVLDDLASLDEAGWLDRGQRGRMEKLRVVIAAAAHEAAQSGRPAMVLFVCPGCGDRASVIDLVRFVNCGVCRVPMVRETGKVPTPELL